jgi:uncharacterized protein YecT (DUF1311 family)
VIRIVLILALMGSPVFADDLDDAYDPAVLQTCLDQFPLLRAQASCIGVGAAKCIEGDAGSSTVGYGFCMSAEWEDWDARLNAVYAVLLVQQANLNDALQAYNPVFPDPVAEMKRMQRAWIVYRDAACDWEHLQWSGGTGAGPATAECLLRLTAQQTLFLEQRAH